MERRWHGYLLSDEASRLDLELVWRFLAEEAYWSIGIPRETFERSIRNSLNFGVYEEASDAQVAFVRAVTDRATFAYVGDVFVVPSLRGRGLGHFMIDGLLAHPDLQGLRQVLLVTRDAHGLYAKSGFAPLVAPERFMEVRHEAAALYRA